MLTILGGLAEFERTLMKARTDVGFKRARARHPLRSAAKAHKAQAPWRSLPACDVFDLRSAMVTPLRAASREIVL
jgi:hypothetical protein